MTNSKVCLLEWAGSAQRICALSIEEYLKEKCWLDMRRLVFHAIKARSQTFDCECAEQVRLFDNHNGPELTCRGVPHFDAWDAWLHKMRELDADTLDTTVLAVSTYDMADVARYRMLLNARWANLEQYTSLANDKQCVMAAVSHDGLNLAHACEALRGDYEVVLRAVEQNGLALRHAGDELRCHPDLILVALKTTCEVDIPPSLTSCRKFALQAVQVRGALLHQFHATIRSDKEVVLHAVKQDAHAHAFSQARAFWADKDVVMQTLSTCHPFALSITRIDKTLLADKDVEALMKQRGIVTSKFSSKAACCDDSNLQFKFVVDQVSRNGHALYYADITMRSNKEVVLAAVTNNGRALQYAHFDLSEDYDVAMAAVMQDGTAIEFVCQALRANRNVQQAALRQTHLALAHIIPLDESMVLFCVEQHGLRSIPHSKRTQRVLHAAAKKSAQVLRHVEKTDFAAGFTERQFQQYDFAKHFVSCWGSDSVLVTEEAHRCCSYSLCVQIMHQLHLFSKRKQHL